MSTTNNPPPAGPFCKDCRHYADGSLGAVCTRSAWVDLVTGEKRTAFLECIPERTFSHGQPGFAMAASPCGPEGKFFEPAPPPPPPVLPKPRRVRFLGWLTR